MHIVRQKPKWNLISCQEVKKKIGRRRSGRHLCVWTCSSLSIAVCFSFPAHTWSTAPFIASHQMACVFVCVYHVHSQLASDKLTDEVKFKKLLICDGKINYILELIDPSTHPELRHFLSPPYPPPQPAQISSTCNMQSD